MLYRLALLIILFVTPTSHLLASEKTKPNLILAKTFDHSIDVKEYWVSEKYDGVRAFWNGTQLITRQGNPINAPRWFTADLSAQPLDGELWITRGSFEKLSGLVRQHQASDEQWRQVNYILFELPQHRGLFTERLKALHEISDQTPKWIQAAPQWRVESVSELTQQLKQFVDGGAEGLMLHKANTRYKSGRSKDLIKLKPHYDSEAVVVAHLPGKGKYQGAMGSLLVRTAGGLRFKIGSGFSDAQRKKPPPVGSVISYKYSGLSNKGTPKFARFWRERKEF